MEAIVVAAVIRKVADIAGSKLFEKISDMSNLQEDIQWIRTEMDFIQAFLKRADSQQDQTDDMKNLKRNIIEIAYDLEDIMDKYFPQITTQGQIGYLTNLPTNHKFVTKIKEIKKRVTYINQRRNTYSVPDTEGKGKTSSWDPRRPFLHDNEQHVVGFDEDVDELEGRLLDTKKEYAVISIVGMPGAGKTTLGKKAFESVAAKKKDDDNSDQFHFDCSAMVYVSQMPNIRDLLLDVARQVSLEKEKREEDLEANLCRLLRGKRYLIFFDDVWNNETWDALEKHIPRNSGNGSRIIITSRSSTVGRYIGGESSLHVLKPLDAENSWRLFSKRMGETFQFSALEDVGRKIVERCRGMPLAIVLAVGMLRGEEQTEHAWREVLASIGQCQELSSILGLSYKYLPIELKPCFLYFGIFPEDYEIFAEELINLWAAEKFIKASGEREVEDVGEGYLRNLAGRNLIQVVRKGYDGRIKSCRIHDLLHSLCISLAEESICFTTLSNPRSDSETSNSDVTVRRITTNRRTITLNNHTRKLRSLLCFHGGKDTQETQYPKRFLQKLKLLRVLSIEGHALRSSLQNKVECLSHLRYLKLRGSGLDKLPSAISKLEGLEVLDVKGCEVLVLPTSIWKMQNLRHILLSPTAIFHPQLVKEVELPNLQSLCDLNGDFLKAECLHSFVNARKLGLRCSMKQFGWVLTDAKPISDKLEKLQLELRDDGPSNASASKYIFPYGLQESKKSHETSALSVSGNEDVPTLNFSGYPNLTRLYLEGPLVKLPEFTASLTKLTFVDSRFEQDPMKELGKLPKLKKLRLRWNSFMGREMVISGASYFPRLEVLIVEPMSSLEALKVQGEVMPILQCVQINCQITLEIDSNRLREIFSKYNDYLMRWSFLDSVVFHAR